MSKRKPSEKVLSDVLRPDVASIFKKRGRDWDVAPREPGIPADSLGAELDDPDPARGLAALLSVGERGRAAVCHPDLLPRVLRRILDRDADVRRVANELRERFLRERNRVYEWLYEAPQEIRWLSVASRRVGRANGTDAWQEFVYNSRDTDEGPRFYYYSLPNVIASYDPTIANAKAFPNYYLVCFDAFCKKHHRRLRGDVLL